METERSAAVRKTAKDAFAAGLAGCAESVVFALARARVIDRAARILAEIE